jgi:RimJ/RimL family protein N-acetyltransferase
MFRTEIEELYNFQSKQQLQSEFSTVKQDRKSVMLYDFGIVKWILMPLDNMDIKSDEVNLYDKKDSTKILFINQNNEKATTQNTRCRKLTKEDSEIFNTFHMSCSSNDKNSGSVSLEDPTVYGCFEEDVLVSVASLWNWGEKLSDIGVLTHPNYRHKGYAREVCEELISQTSKLFIWRCDVKNESSFRLATKLGFKVSGHIHCLIEK